MIFWTNANSFAGHNLSNPYEKMKLRILKDEPRFKHGKWVFRHPMNLSCAVLHH